MAITLKSLQALIFSNCMFPHTLSLFSLQRQVKFVRKSEPTPEVLSAWGAVKCGAHFGFYQSLVRRTWEISLEPWSSVENLGFQQRIQVEKNSMKLI